MDPKQMKQEAKAAKVVAKYSQDYDKTIVIRWIFASFCGMMIAIILLELYTLIFDDGEAPAYLTPEIIHTIFGFIGGWASSVVVNFFAENAAKKLNSINNNEQKEKQ